VPSGAKVTAPKENGASPAVARPSQVPTTAFDVELHPANATIARRMVDERTCRMLNSGKG
jgi:hypothetical protein